MLRITEVLGCFQQLASFDLSLKSVMGEENPKARIHPPTESDHEIELVRIMNRFFVLPCSNHECTKSSEAFASSFLNPDINPFHFLSDTNSLMIVLSIYSHQTHSLHIPLSLIVCFFISVAPFEIAMFSCCASFSL